MRFNTQRNLLAVTVALACSGLNSASAQETESSSVIEESAIEAAATDEASPVPQGSVEEVVVTGIRGSLQESLDTKRFAGSIVDAITAEDLGKFPDKNVAD